MLKKIIYRYKNLHWLFKIILFIVICFLTVKGVVYGTRIFQSLYYPYPQNEFSLNGHKAYFKVDQGGGDWVSNIYVYSYCYLESCDKNKELVKISEGLYANVENRYLGKVYQKSELPMVDGKKMFSQGGGGPVEV